MKKVVGIFLAMVFVFVVINMAFADIYPTYGKAEEMLKEWAIKYGYQECVNETVNADGSLNYCGFLSKAGFEKETGKECTVDNWMEMSIKEFNITEIETKQVGEIEGHAVYYTHAKSNNGSLGSINGVYYNDVYVLFMIYE